MQIFIQVFRKAVGSFHANDSIAIDTFSWAKLAGFQPVTCRKYKHQVCFMLASLYLLLSKTRFPWQCTSICYLSALHKMFILITIWSLNCCKSCDPRKNIFKIIRWVSAAFMDWQWRSVLCSFWLSTAFHFTVSFHFPWYCLSCAHKVPHLPSQVTWQLLVPHPIKSMLHVHKNVLGPLLWQCNKRWPWGLDLFEPNSEPIETKLNFAAPGKK